MAIDQEPIDVSAEVDEARIKRGAFKDRSVRRRSPRGTRLLIAAIIIAGLLAIAGIMYLYKLKARHVEAVQAKEKPKLEEVTDPDSGAGWSPAPPSTAPAPTAQNAAPQNKTTVPATASTSAAPMIDPVTARRLGSGFGSDKDDDDQDRSQNVGNYGGGNYGRQGSGQGDIAGGVDQSMATLQASLQADLKNAKLATATAANANAPKPARGLEDKLAPLKLEPSIAGYLGNRNFLITQGTKIDCGLVGALDTTLPGLVSCVTTRPVWSDNHHVILLDQGTKATGVIAETPVAGETRVFVTWYRLETPDGVIIEVDSPATDANGAGGIAGAVNNHFWLRWGGGLTLSLVSDLGQAAINKASGSGSTVNLNTTGGTEQTMIQQMLNQTVAIPPTITANKAERVSIFVARDLDFSNVYELKR